MKNPTEQFPYKKETVNKDKVETFRVGDSLYDHNLVIPYAEQLPVEEVPLQDLLNSVAEGNYYWDDENGEKLGPYQILTDWEAAKQNPAWRKHVTSIENANLDYPVWIVKDELPVDGMHRITRAFLDNKSTVKAVFFETLPVEAVIKDIKLDEDINSQLENRVGE